jgi:hypothetical protein
LVCKRVIEKFWKSTHEFSGKHLHELKCYIWGTWFIMFYQMRRGQKLKTMMWMSNNEQIWWFVNKWKLMINCVLSKSQNIWTTWFVGPDCRKFWNPDYDYNNVVISFDDDCFLLGFQATDWVSDAMKTIDVYASEFSCTKIVEWVSTPNAPWN